MNSCRSESSCSNKKYNLIDKPILQYDENIEAMQSAIFDNGQFAYQMDNVYCSRVRAADRYTAFSSVPRNYANSSRETSFENDVKCLQCQLLEQENNMELLHTQLNEAVTRCDEIHHGKYWRETSTPIIDKHKLHSPAIEVYPHKSTDTNIIDMNEYQYQLDQICNFKLANFRSSYIPHKWIR